jgi:hypothetical protein
VHISGLPGVDASMWLIRVDRQVAVYGPNTFRPTFKPAGLVKSLMIRGSRLLKTPAAWNRTLLRLSFLACQVSLRGNPAQSLQTQVGFEFATSYAMVGSFLSSSWTFLYSSAFNNSCIFTLLVSTLFILPQDINHVFLKKKSTPIL